MSDPARSTDAGASNPTDAVSRRAVLKGVTGAGAAALGLGAGATLGTSATSGGIPTPWLDVDGNLVRDQVGNAVNLRGVNIADPRRMNEDVARRGKTAAQAVDYLTNADDGWYSRIVRIPCHPWDVAGLPSVWVVRNEYAASERPAEFVCPTEECADGYYEPPLFTEAQLEQYLTNHVDPVVERCRENGVYCIVDFHRHWSGELTWWDESAGAPNANLSQEVERFWNVVAPRYAEDSHVLYEVYNEPTNPGMWGDPTTEDWVATVWQNWLTTAQPWVDTIREHAPRNLVIVGNPGWTQSPEGALVEPFAGDNLAYAYHIYWQHQVSKDGTWAQAGPNGEGTKGVYEEYPMFVTEWGWNADNAAAGGNMVEDFGQPFVDWLESSDAIHWQAWTFDSAWGSDITVRPAFDGDCTNAPCDWELVPGEEMLGSFVKDVLAQYRDAGVPEWADGTDTPTETPTDSCSAPTAPAWSDGTQPMDTDGDGVYEDLNENCEFDSDDVVTYFQEIDRAGIQENPGYYDANGNGNADFDDVVTLFQEL